MLGLLWNNWLLIALIPPLLYAVVALFDAWFVDREIYPSARDATIISTLFGSLPLILPATGLVEIHITSWPVAAVAFGSGILFGIHGYLYVAALFRRNDTVLAETIMNLSVLFVPVLAFFLLGERLSMAHYVGIAFAGLAVLVMYRVSKPGKATNLDGCWLLMLSMLLFSLVLIAGDWVYLRTDFWSGFMIFTLGIASVALVLLLKGDNRKVLRVIHTHWRPFLLIEGLTTLGILCSLRAVDISPSATFVAITECLGAYFILGISLLVFWGGRAAGFRPGALSKLCSMQLDDYPGKIAAGVMITSGIYLVYGS